MDTKNENGAPAKPIAEVAQETASKTAAEVAQDNLRKKLAMEKQEQITRQEKEAAYQEARKAREAAGEAPRDRFDIMSLLDSDIAQALDANQIDRNDAFFAQLIRNTGPADEFKPLPSKGKKK